MILMFLTLIGIGFSFKNNKNFNNNFVEYIVNPKKQQVKMFWKDNKQNNFISISKLKSWLASNKKDLIFATNG